MLIKVIPVFVSMHFRFKLDINANFKMQYGEWMFISLLSTHLTPKDFSLFICCYITPSDYATHFLNNT